MPCELSVVVSTLAESTGAKKLGHPLPESYLADDRKRSLPQAVQR
jgi:hypothetical protein